MDFATAQAVEPAQIPTIDISPLIESGQIDAVAAAIYEAARSSGFFYVKGHGIAPALIDQAFAVSRDFFAQPVSTKSSVAVDKNQRGWMGQGMSKLQGAKTHDLKEVFFWGAEVAEDDPTIGLPLVAQNQWPDDAYPRLRQELTPYYAAVCEVARKVLSALAVSLDQPADFFDAFYDRPLARGQLVYYPPSGDKDAQEERYGVAPHTDFGVLTFLLQDNNGGLQVKLKDGDWIEAPPIEGTLVCNIGDLLQRWSNKRFTSTVHRVINRSPYARYSIPVFFDPRSDAVIDPQDLGISAAESRYEPVQAGAHIAGRNSKSFAQYSDRS